jgi:hypothetical protein
MKRKQKPKTRKHRIIEWLIRKWMPQKDGKSLWKLARIRGPYKMKKASPEQIEQGKELVKKLVAAQTSGVGQEE